MNQTDQLQLKLLQLQTELHDRTYELNDVRKVLVYGLRISKEMFQAEEGTLAVQRKDQSRVDLLWRLPKKSEWDATLLSKYISNARPSIPKHLLMAPIHRRGRPWAVLVLRDAARQFTGIDRKILLSITQTLTDIVRLIDEDRSQAVRRKIEQKIADRRDPKDLLYDLLHGLRSLTRYDHSASVLIVKEGSATMELIAEQIAWKKARSLQIGRRIDLPADVMAQLKMGGTRLFERRGEHWPNANGNTELLRLLDHGASRECPKEVSAVCSVICTPVGAIGILKIAARNRNVLADYEVNLIEEFVPLASMALQFLTRTEDLQERVVQSERKHALANLTRGITHDMNNALGAVLPLVQQLKDDSANGRIVMETLREDLDVIEQSLQTCRRIFGSMLTIARGSRRGIGHGNLRRAVGSALTVLEDSLKRHGIKVNLQLPAELPSIRGSQGDITQLFLNLFTNARDAMAEGGTLTILASVEETAVQVAVQDDGLGIPEAHMKRLSEPFFTTKEDGNGLGLSICRSVLWEINGTMRFDSVPGSGTKILLSLPILNDSDQEASE